MRTLTGTDAAGINRIHWDLRFEPSTEVRLRTSPLYAPYIVAGREGPRGARHRHASASSRRRAATR